MLQMMVLCQDVVMLQDTIVALCRNAIPYKQHVGVQALLAITLDAHNVFLVTVNDVFNRSDANDRCQRHSTEELIKDGAHVKVESENPKGNGAKGKAENKADSVLHSELWPSASFPGGHTQHQVTDSNAAFNQDNVSSAYSRRIEPDKDASQSHEECVFMHQKQSADICCKALTGAIVSLCGTTLPYKVQLRIEGLLAIRVDDSDIYLISVDENINQNNMLVSCGAHLPYVGRTSADLSDIINASMNIMAATGLIGPMFAGVEQNQKGHTQKLNHTKSFVVQKTPNEDENNARKKKDADDTHMENADDIEPGDADDTEPGDANDTEPGDADDIEPGYADDTEPGNAGTEPGDADDMEPGDVDDTEPGEMPCPPSHSVHNQFPFLLDQVAQESVLSKLNTCRSLGNMGDSSQVIVAHSHCHVTVITLL